MTRTIIASLVALSIGVSAMPASAAKSHEKACQRLRDEHPGFVGAFNVTTHKPVWNGSGYDHELRQYVCAAAPGGESVTAMQIEKKPSKGKRQTLLAQVIAAGTEE